MSTQKDEVVLAITIDAPIADGEFFFFFFFFFFVSFYHSHYAQSFIISLSVHFDSIKTLRLSKLKVESFVLFYSEGSIFLLKIDPSE